MLLTLEQCNKIVAKQLNNDKDFKLLSFETVPFRNQLQGLMGEHWTLRVHYASNDEEKAQDFFIKTLSPNPVLLEISKTIMVFEKETLFYKLLDEFEKYNIDTSFAPHGYLFHDGTTVLEDLSLQGYKGTPKGKFLDIDHCKKCLEAMAKFHAASIIYERKKCSDRKFSLAEEFGDELKDQLTIGASDIATRWLQCAIQGLFSLIDLIPPVENVSCDDFKQKLALILEADDSQQPKGLINSILHNDLWTSNFLYNYNDDNVPKTAKLIDFQTITYGPVELDLMKFFMLNTKRAMRETNLKQLIEYYYKNLTNLLIRSQADCSSVLPTSLEFYESCKNFELAGKIHAIVDHSFTFMSDDIHINAWKTRESFENFLFEGRGQFIIDCFQTDTTFKETLVEDAIELRDLLFAI